MITKKRNYPVVDESKPEESDDNTETKRSSLWMTNKLKLGILEKTQKQAMMIRSHRKKVILYPED